MVIIAFSCPLHIRKRQKQQTFYLQGCGQAPDKELHAKFSAVGASLLQMMPTLMQPPPVTPKHLYKTSIRT